MSEKLVPATPEEYKARVLQLLKRIHEICEANGVRYSAAYGTLLGAVRHQGFIPWDDDVDICMPREDYQTFVKAFASEDGRYYTLDSGSSRYYYNNMNRACDGVMTLRLKGVPDIQRLGVFVDIFLLDEWPASTEEQNSYRAELQRSLQNVFFALPWKIYRTGSRRAKLELLVHLPDRVRNHLFVGLSKRKEERDRLMVKYNGSGTGWRNFSGGSRNNVTWMMREEDLDRRILTKFEDTQIYVPENYEELLKNRYGDYMKLPPVEKRKTRHHFTPYWTSEELRAHCQ